VLKIGPYAVLRRLATGGMAEVLLGQTENGRTVALKRVLPHLAGRARLLAQFRIEARATAALRHPGIVRVLDIREEDGLPVLVLEHVVGVDVRTLRARAAEREVAIPAEVVAAILAGAAAALAHAHARGVAHHDVKGSNVLLAWDGTVKLADFGIAAIGHRGDPAADVAALAALGARLSHELPRLPASSAAELSAALCAWLEARHVVARPRIASFLAELFTGEEREHSFVDEDPDEPTLRLRRRRRLGWVAAAGAGLLVALGAWRLTEGRR
jgi:serine/threonine protein kinase